MKKYQLILILVGIFFLISAATTIVYTATSTPLETDIIHTNASIVTNNLIGFNVDTDVLTFGQVPEDGTAKRNVLLHNMRNRPVTVKISSQGNISKYLWLNGSSIIIPPGETHNLSIEFSSETAAYGYYEGTITFTYHRKLLS